MKRPLFFTPQNLFDSTIDLTELGLVHVSLLWPGLSDSDTGYATDGTYDYGGPACISVLRHVLRFATGLTTTYDGHYIDELGNGLGITPDKNNVGLYGFSHPGIAATIVLAEYGSELTGVSYFISNESPTQDLISAIELGYWTNDELTESVLNPFYVYPSSYNAQDIDLTSEYEFVKWDSETGRPYIDGDGKSYYLGEFVPSIYGKRCYSKGLTHALSDNGAFAMSGWPPDVCTPDEADANWSIRETTSYYTEVGTNASWLKVMLLFADRDHVQPLYDKPHIHQAWDGFRDSAKLEWVRLNPDNAYVEAVTGVSLREIPANSPPVDWNDVAKYGFPSGIQDARIKLGEAAVAEMADRTHYSDWSFNLEAPLNE